MWLYKATSQNLGGMLQSSIATLLVPPHVIFYSTLYSNEFLRPIALLRRFPASGRHFVRTMFCQNEKNRPDNALF